MWLSAVSCTVALLSGTEGPQLSPTEGAAWKQIQPSIVSLMDGDVAKGSAALIDVRGYFLAHKVVVGNRSTMKAITSDGRTVNLKLASTDEPTQLVLLIAEKWDIPGRAVTIGNDDERKGSRLFAVLPTGPIRAEFHAADRVGVINPSRRALNLSEIRFESAPENVGGALVFTQGGDFLGALNATLEAADKDNFTLKFQDLGGGGGGVNPLPKMQQTRMGPATLTVAYTVGADALRRVVDGFRSPSHEVFHPSIGMYCRDNNGRGALVDTVKPGSPAALAGIQPGDVVENLDGTVIRDQVDYARVLLRQNVGNVIQLQVRRGPVLRTVLITVGK
jgi:S1-C subfamily serine protease